MSALPTEAGKSAFEANRAIFTADELAIAQTLLDADQAHLFAAWPQPGSHDADKKRLLHQCAEVERVCVGGIRGYVQRAKELLRLSAIGANPYEGFTVNEPSDSARLETTSDFTHYESLGMSVAPHAAFVVVAGGLGERLGYKGIKLALPSEITTETCFIELYIKQILALQERARAATGNANLLLPLGIMTSDDTDALTRELLTSHNNFGMRAEQLTIFKQGKVPSMVNDAAHFCLEEKDPFALDTKPHGHGDVHVLLYQTGLAKRFVTEFGTKYLVFFQDTNGLVFRAIVAALGVSAEKKLEMNSLTVPRVTGDAVGAICKLVRTPEAAAAAAAATSAGEREALPDQLTINVEYNQLEGLMGTGVKEPLIPGTKFAIYPGNINVLVFDAPAYVRVLEAKKGVISEFVNPKYNADKKTFKKPTRLECMMQDWPKLLDSGAVVGFSQFHRWTSFSAVKNALADGAQKQRDGNAPETGTSGEADIYLWSHRVLKEAGVQIAEPVATAYGGCQVELPPRVVLAPSVGVTQAEVKSKFVGGANVHIHRDATLVLDGANIVVRALDLHGTLIVRAVAGARVTIDGLTVNNKGWSLDTIDLATAAQVDQKYTVRGYTLGKHEQAEFVFGEAGEFTLSDATKAAFEKK